MSEIINNREYRQRVLKELIRELHDGKSVEEVRERFAKLIEGVSASEISQMEQALIMEGMPIAEVQRLCDVHAAVFKGSIQEIHHPDEIPGHPVHTFKIENREIEKLLEDIKKHLENFKKDDSKESVYKLIEDFNALWDIDKHYSRKENLLFPYLEKYGITAPPKVMWGVDDEIRDMIKGTKSILISYSGNRDEVISRVNEAVDKVSEMIFKEENILLPMAIDTLTQDEWINIMNESDEIGYCLTEPQGKWKPERVDVEAKEEKKIGDENSKGYIKFETGILKPEEISALLNHLPVDITFIDKDDVVKYFNQAKDRIFARTKAVIGRTVQNCHPPASVHIVNKMLDDFKSGKKDHEDFWIKMGDKYVFIRYFAVRDERGEYMGTLEVTQDIKPIQEITGEKRLLGE
ncbi:DUF438 domain-containing protein [Fonticella tunisiensis]|uniref:Uncharacterized protein n=1 Tax=Fonticella tunisiensis TaxID=1096341 RepID=A0A4R7KTE1_9CLOT|nr:DUF438 domain-containing protein [Fonticella tunisiensis]TDT63357.1 hypothetical protein EDD71_102117 [Fonticella tunisiensis]